MSETKAFARMVKYNNRIAYQPVVQTEGFECVGQNIFGDEKTPRELSITASLIAERMAKCIDLGVEQLGVIEVKNARIAAKKQAAAEAKAKKEADDVAFQARKAKEEAEKAAAEADEAAGVEPDEPVDPAVPVVE